MVWYSHFSGGKKSGLVFPSLKEFSSLLWSTVKGFSVVNEIEVYVLLQFSCFSYDPTDAGNLISAEKPFLNPAWTSGNSRFTYCWSLAWRILGIILRACEMSAICGSLNILWLLPFLGLEWKLTFSSLVDTAEFSKFAAILSAALSQHHLSGFEIAQLEFHHLH